ncbi:MAG: signal peptidase I, partial [Pseudomonadota bacterium]
ERIDDYVEDYVRRGTPLRPPRCQNRAVRPGEQCVKEQYLETFPGGPTHRLLNIEGPMDGVAGGLRNQDNTPVFTVPEGHFFFMGDNRDNSIDSRFNDVGYVPFENLIGRADVIAMSSDGPFWQVWNWRADRFFQGIE